MREVRAIQTVYLAGLLTGAAVFLFLGCLRQQTDRTPRLKADSLVQGTVSLFTPLAGRVYPETVRSDLEKKFLWGGFNALTVTEFLSIKIASAVVFPVLGSILALGGGNPVPLLLLGFLGYIAPDLYLQRKIQERQAKIARDVPDFALLLATVLDAGGGDIQTALIQVGRRLGGEIGSELENTLREIGAGSMRRTALQNMAERCGVDELTQLIRAILQAEFYGAPIAESVRAFANQLTTLRRFHAHKRAGEQAVKMILPMLLFVVLPLMILIAYPAIRQFGRVLGQ